MSATVTESETDTFEEGIGVLAADASASFDDDAPWKVSGVAMPVNTVVNGGRNVDHFFPAEVLRAAVDLLIGRKIVKNFHEMEGQAPADDVIGEITDAAFHEGVGLVFEGEIADRDIANKIKHGYLDVSPSVARSLGPLDETMGARRVDEISGFRDLAVVMGGQPGATIQMGGNPAVTALSMDALSRAFETDVDTYRISEPEFNGYDTAAWDAPTLEDTFGGDMDAARNSATWIDGDGENFTDLSLFVLNGDAELNVNALDSAWRLASQTDGPTEEDVARLRTMYEDMAEEANDVGAITDDEFDDVWQDRVADTDTNAATGGDDGTAQSTDGPRTDDDQPDTLTMSDLTEPEQALLAAVDDPEAALEVLSEYDSREEPAIVEQTDLDTLQAENKTVKEVLARELEARGSPFEVDVLMERFTVSELSDRLEDDEGNIEFETLGQSPETEEPDDPEEPEGDTLSDEDRDRIETIRAKKSILRDRAPRRWEALQQEACDLAGVDDYTDIELEAY